MVVSIRRDKVGRGKEACNNTHLYTYLLRGGGCLFSWGLLALRGLDVAIRVAIVEAELGGGLTVGHGE